MKKNLATRLENMMLIPALVLALLVCGCSGDSDTSASAQNGSDTSSSDPDSSSEPTDASTDEADTSTETPPKTDAATEEPDTTTEESDASVEEADASSETPAEPIGNPTEEAIAIDHATAFGTVEKNIKDHINDLDSALSFFESSESVRNMVDMLSDDDDDEESEEGEESKEDDEIEVDFSEMRDSMVDILADNIMVESTSTVAEDGLSITYAMSADHFCDQEPEDDESEEQKNERMDEEAECAERLAKNPVNLVVSSDGEGRMDLSIQAGADSVEAVKLQIHDDVISIASDISNLNNFFKVFVDPEDFALPKTMEGSFGCEVREESSLKYAVRCTVFEDINAVPSDDQDPYGLKLDKAEAPLTATLDGQAQTIEGLVTAMNINLSLPWQMVVDLFHDDEGDWENVCKTKEDGSMECQDEWVEPEPVVEVEETLTVSVPHVQGALNYARSDDTFRITEVAMNGEQVTLNVDKHTIVAFDLNPDAGYVMGMNMRGDASDDMRFQMQNEIDLQVKMHWEPVSSALEDPPGFLMDETISVRFEGSDTPTIDVERDDDDTQVKVSSGTLTLSSTAMDNDVVIAEGQCFAGIDTDDMSEEEKDALHDLFGELMADTCED